MKKIFLTAIQIKFVRNFLFVNIAFNSKYEIFVIYIIFFTSFYIYNCLNNKVLYLLKFE